MARLRAIACLLFAAVALFPPARACAEEADITGELKQWHRVTLTFAGPSTSEDAEINPFRDYRMIVLFVNDANRLSLEVPGFFAADGNAAESGAEKGNRWRVHFAPPAEGKWDYFVSFRTGKDIAVNPNRLDGEPVFLHGSKGSFSIAKTDKTGRDFRGKGDLRYVGEHYLRFAGSKEFFIKSGADSPENLLGYADFDGTYRHARQGPNKGPNRPEELHRYQPHVRDWREGDPTWMKGKGKGLIGGLNYLSDQGVNSIYFLTMNVDGDGRDAWPWIRHDVRDRFDCSKLDQWEIVFSHATARGIMLHVVTQETENDQLLDGGELGLERKLYYRELIARFAHHPALVWNLGEENTNTDAQRQAFCRYIRDLDPYDHPIVCHTFHNKYDQVYAPLLGDKNFEGLSLQTNEAHEQVKRWVDRSAQAGRRWFVCLDEIGPANTGVKPDSDDAEHFDVRSKHLWGTLMAGGAGVEWYFGYKYANNDLNCEDWRSREAMWKQTRIAREFFEKYVSPYFTRAEQRTLHMDELITAKDGYCLAAPADLYVIYLPHGGTTELNVGRVKQTFAVRWFNPREGGELVKGSKAQVDGPGMINIGRPPADESRDWVAVVTTDTSKLGLASFGVVDGYGGGRYTPGAAVPIRAADKPGMTFDRWTHGSRDLGDEIDAFGFHQSDKAVTIGIVPDAKTVVTAHFKQDRPAPAAPNAQDGRGKLVSFTLMNADTGKPIEGFDPIADNAVIKLGKLSTRKLNIRANVEGEVAEVVFELDGKKNFRKEGAAPFALAGDAQGKYNPWTPSTGQHTLAATAGGGSLKVTFTVEE